MEREPGDDTGEDEDGEDPKGAAIVAEGRVVGQE